ncbi:hypothetical protein CKALI_08720 [Corynebacterium kalinowskii]|uniref:Uncharacterized protein n=1 Tax=Corynebacterium kalinowskii TaxID=2675216 RepID=A0A6B8VEK2_9CORY|nr:hypothetical protein [Corynebacterium kalinowskii]QGU02603.1 hypothetical protein CKALI_08720 [Corynebacterium kalinowskii]
MQPHDAVVTLWFVNADDPAAVLSAEPKADRGFGRKYLALMDPTWPIAVFGQFPLNRSVAVSKGEFYIAGYPGITIVQTLVSNMTVLSELSPKLLSSVTARDVYAFAENTDTGFGGIAHWREGKIRRSFCARRDRVYEDIGLPEAFENPFWSGERATGPKRGIDLPFDPIDLVHEADVHWLGVDISAEGPDLSVVGYAIDGRKEPRIQSPKTAKSVADVVSAASTKLGINPNTRDYDDYEDAPAPQPADNHMGAAVHGSKQLARRVGRRLRTLKEVVQDKLRHTDRG